MMNQLSLVCGLFGLIFFFQVNNIKPDYVRITEVIATLIFFVVPFINRLGWFTAAKYIHYIVLNFYCFIIVLSLGFKSGYELLYIPIIAASSLVANFRKTKYIIHALGIPLVSILLLLYFDDSLAIDQIKNGPELNALYSQNFLFTVIMSFLVAFFYYRITDQQNGMLRNLLEKQSQLNEDLQRNEKKIHRNLQYSDALLERLKASKDYFKSLLQNASDITLVVNERGEFKYITPSFYRITGFKPEHMFGKVVFDFLHPDDVPEGVEKFNRRMNPEIETKQELFKFRCKKFDGSYLVLEAIGTNLLDDPNVKGFVINSRDITERIHFEQEAILKEKNIRSILDNNNNFIYLIDKEFRILDFNLKFGKAIADNYGIKLERNFDILAVTQQEEREKWLKRYQTALKGEVQTYTDFFAEGGSTYKVSIFPIVNADAEVERITVFMQNITEQVKIDRALIEAKEAAEEATKAKGLFLSTMSHEIRTPMNAVIGMTHLLLQEDPKPEQVENLNLLKFSAENLLVLINDILDFSKIEAGKVILEKTPFDLGYLITNIKNTLLPAAREKNIELTMLLDSEMPKFVVGDPVRLSQIMTNLIGNGIKFTEKGQVQVKVTLLRSNREDCEIEFEVNDTGIGIPQSMQEEIFESFTQGSSDTTRRFGGTGLGLAITKRLLELMGGKIMLRSKEGAGSAFFFRLQFNKHEEKPEAMHTPSNNEDSLQILKGCRILMVEDNPLNAFVGTKFLQKWGVELDIAENGKIALEMVEKNSYDLIMMDLQMPVMDGYEATLRIRELKDPQKAGVPILAISAAAEQHIQNKAMEVGMNDYVHKPFIPDELRLKLSRYLQNRKVNNP